MAVSRKGALIQTSFVCVSLFGELPARGGRPAIRQAKKERRFAFVAIFHLSARIVSRAKGQSAVAKAAYNSRDNLENENTGERHDYRRQGEIMFSGIFAPKNAPGWAKDRQALWSEVEKKETRKNSQLAREIEIALPHELTDKQRENLVKDFVRENFVRKGMIADVGIHAPAREGDERNYHAHILLTMREIGPEGFGEKMRQFNSKAQLDEWRESWERTSNRYLERFGHEARIDRRTLKAQGIDREPTTHLGPTATQIEREGKKSDRGTVNQEIEERNKEREGLRLEAHTLNQELMLSQHAGSVTDFLEHQEAAKLDKEAEYLKEAQHRPEAWAEEQTLKSQAHDVGEMADKGLKVAGKVLDAPLKALEGVLEFFVSAPPKTPEQQKQKAEEKKQTQEETGKFKAKAEEDRRQIFFEKLAAEAEEIKKQERERGRKDEFGRERERER